MDTSIDAMEASSDAMDSSVDTMDTRVGDDAASVRAGSNCPHHRLASMEGVKHGVSHGGGDGVGDVVGPEGHVVDNACAIGHWVTGVNVGVAHGRRDHAGRKGHGVESSPGMDSVHHGLCLPLGHPVDVLDGGLRVDPLHHMLHLTVLGDIGGVMDSCCNGHHVMG